MHFGQDQLTTPYRALLVRSIDQSAKLTPIPQPQPQPQAHLRTTSRIRDANSYCIYISLHDKNYLDDLSRARLKAKLSWIVERGDRIRIRIVYVCVCTIHENGALDLGDMGLCRGGGG